MFKVKQKYHDFPNFLQFQEWWWCLGKEKIPNFDSLFSSSHYNYFRIALTVQCSRQSENSGIFIVYSFLVIRSCDFSGQRENCHLRKKGSLKEHKYSKTTLNLLENKTLSILDSGRIIRINYFCLEN